MKNAHDWASKQVSKWPDPLGSEKQLDWLGGGAGCSCLARFKVSGHKVDFNES